MSLPGISPNAAWRCGSQRLPSRRAKRRNGRDRNGLVRLNFWPRTRNPPRSSSTLSSELGLNVALKQTALKHFHRLVRSSDDHHRLRCAKRRRERFRSRAQPAAELRHDGDVRRAQAGASADAGDAALRTGGTGRHRHRGGALTGMKSARPNCRRSIPRATNMIAASSMRSRARCPAQSHSRRPPRRVPAPAMSGSARRGRSMACRHRWSRRIRQSSTTRGSAACWSAPAWATFPSC